MNAQAHCPRQPDYESLESKNIGLEYEGRGHDSRMMNVRHVSSMLISILQACIIRPERAHRVVATERVSA